MFNPWLSFFGLTQLAVESQTVIAMRLMRLAAGGKRASQEAERMVSEKLSSLMEVQAAATRDLLRGEAHLVPVHAVAHYRRKVRANRIRLSGR